MTEASGADTDEACAFDVFLSHDHQDASAVERLATVLTQRYGFRVWLDRWVLVPGEKWQQSIHKALTQTRTCAVCIGSSTARGWFREEVETALNIQASDSSYRVIPVLLPDAADDTLGEIMPGFLESRTWVDFRPGQEDPYALHVLDHGIRGVAPGPWPVPAAVPPTDDAVLTEMERDLIALAKLKPYIHEAVAIEHERRILSRRFG